MNYYALIGLFNGVVILFFAVALFLRKPRINFYKSFLSFSVLVGLWSIFYAIWQIQTEHNLALFWMRIAMLMVYPSSFGFLWFVMEICGVQITKTIKCSLILIPTFFAFFTFSPLMIKDVAAKLMFPYWPIPGPLMCLYTFLFCFCVFISFLLLIITYFRSVGAHQWQIKWIIFTMLPAWVGGSTNWLLWYGVEFPPLPNFFVGVGWLLLAYAMIRTRLFDVDVLADYIQEARLSAIGLLTSSIHHEIKSPVFVIRGLAESLAEKTEPLNLSNNETVQRQILETTEKIIQQTERITGIIRKFRDFATRSKGQNLEIQSLNVQDVLNNIMPIIQSQIYSKRIQLEMSVPDGLKVFADLHSVEEILINLLLNACQAVSDSGKISLYATDDAGEVKITISDNGPGLTVQEINRLFEPFYTTKKEGTGLGLYVVKQLVERNKAKIEIQRNFLSGISILLSFPKL